ncbi:transposon Ty3-I Gag-Pol polyprotein [Trichonephila clavipes]|uniref:Transposon Ty3-I Gag-Pol polyprotein n=1 Tax=Trichonephila clavipes TaxID=2585209 RepID=A0A8X6VRF7_TRICX|nr:transposon Ty3-I Gag-Pol polyprotein [Trichonephila clavipes]
MEEKQNCMQTLVNKGSAQFCYKKPKMESYIPFTTCRKRQIQQKKKDYAKKGSNYSHSQMGASIRRICYEIEHRAGSRMKHVDALSRYPVIMVCNGTLTSKLKKAQGEDDNIQTLKSLLAKQESEEFYE